MLTTHDFALLATLAGFVFLQLDRTTPAESALLYGRVYHWVTTRAAGGVTRPRATRDRAAKVLATVGGILVAPSPRTCGAGRPPPGLFGVAWTIFYAAHVATVWRAATGAAADAPAAALSTLYALFFAHAVLIKLWPVLFWAGAADGAELHDLTALRLRGAQMLAFPASTAALGSARRWLDVDEAGEVQGPSAARVRTMLAASVAVILAALGTGVATAAAFARVGLKLDAALWAGYAAWLAWATYLNVAATVYFWVPSRATSIAP